MIIKKKMFHLHLFFWLNKALLLWVQMRSRLKHVLFFPISICECEKIAHSNHCVVSNWNEENKKGIVEMETRKKNPSDSGTSEKRINHILLLLFRWSSAKAKHTHTRKSRDRISYIYIYIFVLQLLFTEQKQAPKTKTTEKKPRKLHTKTEWQYCMNMSRTTDSDVR